MISKGRRMARGIDRGLDFIPRERGRLFSKIFSQTIPGALALALSALFGVWILYLRPAGAPYAVEAPGGRTRGSPCLESLRRAVRLTIVFGFHAGLACEKLST